MGRFLDCVSLAARTEGPYHQVRACGEANEAKDVKLAAINVLMIGSLQAPAVVRERMGVPGAEDGAGGAHTVGKRHRATAKGHGPPPAQPALPLCDRRGRDRVSSSPVTCMTPAVSLSLCLCLSVSLHHRHRCHPLLCSLLRHTTTPAATPTVHCITPHSNSRCPAPDTCLLPASFPPLTPAPRHANWRRYGKVWDDAGAGADFQFPWETKPQMAHSQVIAIPSLVMDRTPVTCAQYSAYIAATA